MKPLRTATLNNNKGSEMKEMSDFVGIVKDPENDYTEEENTFSVTAMTEEDAVLKIGKKYVETYNLTDKHPVTCTKVVINDSIYSLDYFESWDYLVIKQ